MRIRKIWSMSTYRLLLLVIIVVLPLNILTLILGNMTVSDVQKKITEENQNVMNLYMRQIDISIEQITSEIHRCAVDDIDFSNLNTPKVESKNEYYDKMQSVVGLRHTLDHILENNNYISGVFALFPKNDFNIMEYDNTYLFAYRSELEDYIKEKFINSKNQQEFRKWHVIKLENTNMLFFIAQYRYAYYGAWIDIEKLADGMALSEIQGNGSFVFMNDGEEIYYSNNSDNIEWIHEGNPDYVIIKTKSQYADFNLVQIIKKSEFTKLLPAMIKILKMISILALAILPVILIFMRKWMISPMNRLVHAMQEIESGNMQYRITEKEIGSEFVQINHNFNNVMDQVSKLKIDVYEEKLEKQRINMRFLSQQIQPHFILNTINILYSYEKEEYPLIQEMLICLADYFRYIVNAKSDFVELKEEMDHIRNYFKIQQVRYPKTFFAMVEYDDNLSECMIPPLLIQNFAENAIKYSIKVGNEIDIFVIAQCYQENKVRIRVMDTGNGIDAELIEKVKIFQTTGKYQDGIGVGIHNAVERLNILYGDDKEFCITREQPHGTRIDIILPVLTRKDIDENMEEL